MLRHDGNALSDAVIGGNVARYRQLKGWSQADLAREMTRWGFAMQQQTVLKIEKGSRSLKASEAQVLAELLGTTFDRLMEPYSGDSEETKALIEFMQLVREIQVSATMIVEMTDQLAEQLQRAQEKYASAPQAVHDKFPTVPKWQVDKILATTRESRHG